MYKKNVKNILLLAFIIFFSTVAFLFFQDPFQKFCLQEFNPNRIISDMRIQSSAIIEHYNFDSIILGTSMLENSSSQEASTLLGSSFINISISGSSFFERKFLLEYALKNKKISKVIYSLDSCYLDCTTERNDYNTDNWAYLYDDSKPNDYKMIFSKLYLKAIIKKYFKYTSVDKPAAWMNDSAYTHRFGGISNWIKSINAQDMSNFIFVDLPKQVELSKNKSLFTSHNTQRDADAIKYVNEYLLKYVTLYPQTEFHLIFPPYFRYRYAVMRQNDPESFFIHQSVIRYLAEKTSEYKNLFVYGFENEDFTKNIALYKDTSHYNTDINSLFIKSIAHKNNLLTQDNVDNYLYDCEVKAYEYDLKELYKQFQEALLNVQGVNSSM